MADTERVSPPPTTGIHHFSPTVSDIEASAEWYAHVFGMTRLDRLAPHHGHEDGGYAVLLVEPNTGFLIGLHHHEGFHGGQFDERRAGLDHLAWGVATRADLDAWAEWLTQRGVLHSGVIEKPHVSYAAIVFRDPDNIQLELFFRYPA